MSNLLASLGWLILKCNAAFRDGKKVPLTQTAGDELSTSCSPGAAICLAPCRWRWQKPFAHVP